MYSGDVPSTSGHHNSQPPFYSHPPPIHHTQGASSSSDVPPEESPGSSSPQYIEMMPMRVTNGGVEQMGMDGGGGGGGEEFPLEEMIEEDTIGMGLEGEVEEVNKTNGDGGGGEPKKDAPPIIPPKKMFKVEQYNIKKNIREFWPVQKQRVEKMSVKYLREASRNQVLPLARVKKIMKIDENVQKQMIAADAPLLLSVASEMFIEELTLRSWEVTEESKRKTLQKTDVATASTRHEHMDFLIDIIPRTGIQPRPKEQIRVPAGGGRAQMVQIVREGPTVGQMLKGGAILAEGVASTSNQQEFSARLESGEEAQVIQIGKPIPLSSQAISQLGLGPLPPPVAHHSSHPSHSSHPPHHQSHSTHTPHFQVPHPPQHPSSHLHSHPSQNSHSSTFTRPSTSSQPLHPSHSRPSTSSSSLHSSYPSTSSHSYQFHPLTPQSHQSLQSHSSSSSHPHQSHPSTSSHSQSHPTARIPSHFVSTPHSNRGKVIPRGGKGVPNRQYQPYPSPSQAGPSRGKN